MKLCAVKDKTYARGKTSLPFEGPCRIKAEVEPCRFTAHRLPKYFF